MVGVTRWGRSRAGSRETTAGKLVGAATQTVVDCILIVDVPVPACCSIGARSWLGRATCDQVTGLSLT